MQTPIAPNTAFRNVSRVILSDHVRDRRGINIKINETAARTVAKIVRYSRRERLGELQAYLGVQPFGRQNYRNMARIAFNESIGTDRGEAIVGAMVAHLRQNSFCCLRLPFLKKSLSRRGLAPESRPIRS
jgi:hypothetical protein